MKKWLLILIALIVIIIVGQKLDKNELKVIPKTIQEEEHVDYTLLDVDEEQVHTGELLLINGKHQLHPVGIAGDLVTVDREQAVAAGFALSNDELQLSGKVLAAFEKMIAAAKLDDIDQFLVTSGYRSLEHQAQLYVQEGSDYALPAGYSEHNSGLALDISSILAKMEFAPEGKWLQQHGAAYGFILRYPEHKQHITGIAYEPWHFRYVGLPHSLIMQERDLVLEEYIEYLAEQEQLTVKSGNKTYTITYYQDEPQLKVKIASNVSYEISGTNTGGIIVTTTTEEAE